MYRDKGDCILVLINMKILVPGMKCIFHNRSFNFQLPNQCAYRQASKPFCLLHVPAGDSIASHYWPNFSYCWQAVKC